jgi:DNA-binding LytR/AlgR family response regulator
MPLQLDHTIALRTTGCTRFAAVRELMVIEARDNYSEATLANGTRLRLRKSLKAWQALLPAPCFLRVHRTLIVNLTLVVRYERDRDERTRLFLHGLPAPVSASRRTWHLLRRHLAELHVPI